MNTGWVRKPDSGRSVETRKAILGGPDARLTHPDELVRGVGQRARV